MTGPEHYTRAEQLLREVRDGHQEGTDVVAILAAAQVHATLALAAATTASAVEAAEPVYASAGSRIATLNNEAKAMALSASPEAWVRLGRRLRERRDEAGLSRRALSEKAEVSETAIKNAEEGRVPSGRWPQSITRISHVLGWAPGTAAQIVLTECAPKVTEVAR